MYKVYVPPSDRRPPCKYNFPPAAVKPWLYLGVGQCPVATLERLVQTILTGSNSYKSPNTLKTSSVNHQIHRKQCQSTNHQIKKDEINNMILKSRPKAWAGSELAIENSFRRMNLARVFGTSRHAHRVFPMQRQTHGILWAKAAPVSRSHWKRYLSRSNFWCQTYEGLELQRKPIAGQIASVCLSPQQNKCVQMRVRRNFSFQY